MFKTHAGRTTTMAVVLVGMVFASLVAPSQVAVADSSMETEFVNALNSERKERGIAPLAVATDVRKVARDWSDVMAANDTLEHNPDYANQTCCWKKVGENVGVGPSVKSLHSALMNSPGHRKNMLDADFNQVGIGVTVVDGRVWVTQVFRNNPDAASSAPKTDKPKAEEPKAEAPKTDKPKTDEPASKPEPKPAPAKPAGPSEQDKQQEKLRGDQERLKALGYYTGQLDGQLGPQTKAATSAFQRASDLEATGTINQATRDALHDSSAISAQEAANREAARKRAIKRAEQLDKAAGQVEKNQKDGVAFHKLKELQQQDRDAEKFTPVPDQVRDAKKLISELAGIAQLAS